MSTTTQDTTSWPELAIGLYDKLTGRGAEITYEFDNLEVMVPNGATENPSFGQWTLNGSIKVSTRDAARKTR